MWVYLIIPGDPTSYGMIRIWLAQVMTGHHLQQRRSLTPNCAISTDFSQFSDGVLDVNHLIGISLMIAVT